jgi:hypothetical protein
MNIRARKIKSIQLGYDPPDHAPRSRRSSPAGIWSAGRFALEFPDQIESGFFPVRPERSRRARPSEVEAFARAAPRLRSGEGFDFAQPERVLFDPKF